MKPRPSEKRESWLLIKERDEFVRPREEYDVIAEQPESVVTGARWSRWPPRRRTGRRTRPRAVRIGARELIRRACRPLRRTVPETAIDFEIGLELATLVLRPPVGEGLARRGQVRRLPGSHRALRRPRAGLHAQPR